MKSLTKDNFVLTIIVHLKLQEKFKELLKGYIIETYVIGFFRIFVVNINKTVYNEINEMIKKMKLKKVKDMFPNKNQVLIEEEKDEDKV